MHVAQVEARTAVERQVTATLIAAGAKVELPDYATERARFDEDLNAQPAPETPLQALLRKVG